MSDVGVNSLHFGNMLLHSERVRPCRGPPKSTACLFLLRVFVLLWTCFFFFVFFKLYLVDGGNWGIKEEDEKKPTKVWKYFKRKEKNSTGEEQGGARHKHLIVVIFWFKSFVDKEKLEKFCFTKWMFFTTTLTMRDFGVLSDKQQVAHLLYYFIVTFNTCG